MGWTSYYKPGYQSVREALEERFCRETEYGKGEFVDFAMVGSTAYIAFKQTLKRQEDIERAKRDYEVGSDGSYTFGLVVLTSSKWDGPYNFGYKDMDEGTGPYQASCPKRILDKLSPLAPGNDRYAKEWRERCLATLAAKREKAKSRNKLEHGAIIRTAKPIEFKNGMKVQCFKVSKDGRKMRFWTRADDGRPGLWGGYYVRLPAWCLEGFEIVAESEEALNDLLKEAA